MSEKHSAAMRRRWEDPAYRAKKLAAMGDPHYVAQRIAGTRQYHKTHPSPMLGYEKSTTAKARIRPKGQDIYWAAGFLEGEGNFSHANAMARNGSGTYVSAYQVNKEPVERLLHLFGGSLSHRMARGNANAVWVWRACGSRARGISMTIFGLMSAKRQGQIRRAIGIL